LKDVLIVTMGSKARDLRRGAEKLPGRKGRLSRTEYLFLPVSYREFHKNCAKELGQDTWLAYLLSGGSPIACNDIYQFERLPEFFIQLTRDWILGDVVTSGRSRLTLQGILRTLFRFGGLPLGFAKLAREAGLANNTVASGYIEALSDLLCCLPAWPWSAHHQRLDLRKPCKVHFINLAAAVAFHPNNLRLVSDFRGLPGEEQGVLLEWLVAQELWRRGALQGRELPDDLGYWRSDSHEIDFVCGQALDHALVEVKTGRAGPLDFKWFPAAFPKRRLNVICRTPFESGAVKGTAWEDFLLGAPLEI
jgi:predicted AAA+ superfamily ATPase